MSWSDTRYVIAMPVAVPSIAAGTMPNVALVVEKMIVFKLKAASAVPLYDTNRDKTVFHPLPGRSPQVNAALRQKFSWADKANATAYETVRGIPKCTSASKRET